MNDSSADHSRIALSHEEMREFGYRVVDLLADHFANVQDGPVGAKRDPAQLISLFDQDPPETGCDPKELLAQLERDVFPKLCFGTVLLQAIVANAAIFMRVISASGSCGLTHSPFLAFFFRRRSMRRSAASSLASTPAPSAKRLRYSL